MKKIKNEEIVQIAGIDFIKFPDQNGCTPILAKKPLFEMTFGKNNDFRESRILKSLQKDVLPKIASEVGEENIVLHDVDLTALDGMQDYGTMQTRISIPTLDFYRQNNKLIRKYNPGSWWWLATPSTNVTDFWALCVSPSGLISGDYYYCGCGVRPFLILKSSIFESLEA
jgi:hypothetical protein